MNLTHPNDPTWSTPLAFSENNWFYPTLILYLQGNSVVTLMAVFDSCIKNQPLRIPFLICMIASETEKRLGTFLQFQGKYYQFQPHQLMITLSVKSFMYDSISSVIHTKKSSNSPIPLVCRDSTLRIAMQLPPGKLSIDRESSQFAWNHMNLFMRHVEKFMRCVFRFLDEKTVEFAFYVSICVKVCTRALEGVAPYTRVHRMYAPIFNLHRTKKGTGRGRYSTWNCHSKRSGTPWPFLEGTTSFTSIYSVWQPSFFSTMKLRIREFA